jgi:hypothetical protein
LPPRDRMARHRAHGLHAPFPHVERHAAADGAERAYGGDHPRPAPFYSALISIFRFRLSSLFGSRIVSTPAV